MKEIKIEADVQFVVGKQGRPMLDYILRLGLRADSGFNNSCAYGIDGAVDPDPEFVELVLSQGANPNQHFGDLTVWGHFLFPFHEERQWLRESKEIGPWLQTTKILILYGAEADLECDIEIDHGSKANLEYDTGLDHGANTNLECDIGLGHDEKIYKRKIYSLPLNVLRSTFGHPKTQQLKFPLPNKANHSRRRMFIEKLTDKFT